MKKRILMYLVASVCLVMVGYASRTVYDNVQEGEIKKVGSNFIEAMTGGRSAAAYELTTKEMREQFTEEDLKYSVGKVVTANLAVNDPSVLRGVSSEGKKVKIYRQEVHNLPEHEGSTSAIFLLTMVKEGRQWRVGNVVVQ